MLTVVTGLVDAVSYVALGHVFVANMTGNVVFVGFAIAGAAGLSLPASLAAMAGFLVGAVAGGRLGVRLGAHRGRNLRAAATISASLVALAVVVAAVAGQPVDQGPRYGMIVLLALALGVQNATAAGSPCPTDDTVLTLTLTGIAADSRLAGGAGGRPGRRRVSSDIRR